jgi:hypothetical protein
VYLAKSLKKLGEIKIRKYANSHDPTVPAKIPHSGKSKLAIKSPMETMQNAINSSIKDEKNHYKSI